MAKQKSNVSVEDERTKRGLIFDGKNAKTRESKRKRKFCQPQIPEDMIFIVLKRLPAKSLMRFKIVCKAWHDLISDPYFAESHYAHSQTRPDSSYFLFYVRNEEFCSRAVFSTNPDGVFSSQLPVQIFDRSPPCTNIVNGLICLWDKKIGTIQLLNLTTGEKIALPGRESMSSYMPSQFYEPSHVLGFDQFNKQYKVLYFCRGRRGKEMKNCYIITLGSMSWRKIIDKPQVGLVRKSISVNGAIYWKDKIFRNGERFVQYFDVREEKFLLLSVPNELGNKELKFITEVGGNLALGFPIRYKDYSEITLWRQKNHDQVWVKATIKLPELVSSGRSIRIVGSTKSGEILLTSKWSLDEYWDTLIFYNLKKRRKYRTRKITMNGQPNSVGALLSSLSLAAVSHHVENILPLKLISKREKSEEKAKKQRFEVSQIIMS